MLSFLFFSQREIQLGETEQFLQVMDLGRGRIKIWPSVGFFDTKCLTYVVTCPSMDTAWGSPPVREQWAAKLCCELPITFEAYEPLPEAGSRILIAETHDSSQETWAEQRSLPCEGQTPQGVRIDVKRTQWTWMQNGTIQTAERGVELRVSF